MVSSNLECSPFKAKNAKQYGRWPKKLKSKDNIFLPRTVEEDVYAKTTQLNLVVCLYYMIFVLCLILILVNFKYLHRRPQCYSHTPQIATGKRNKTRFKNWVKITYLRTTRDCLRTLLPVGFVNKCCIYIILKWLKLHLLI